MNFKCDYFPSDKPTLYQVDYSPYRVSNKNPEKVTYLSGARPSGEYFHESVVLNKFVNLEYLDFSENKVGDTSEMELKYCPKLKSLDISDNCLMELDVSTCVNLEFLDCREQDTEYLEIDLTNCKKLKVILCDKSFILINKPLLCKEYT